MPNKTAVNQTSFFTPLFFIKFLSEQKQLILLALLLLTELPLAATYNDDYEDYYDRVDQFLPIGGDIIWAPIGRGYEAILQPDQFTESMFTSELEKREFDANFLAVLREAYEGNAVSQLLRSDYTSIFYQAITDGKLSLIKFLYENKAKYPVDFSIKKDITNNKLAFEINEPISMLAFIASANQHEIYQYLFNFLSAANDNLDTVIAVAKLNKDMLNLIRFLKPAKEFAIGLKQAAMAITMSSHENTNSIAAFEIIFSYHILDIEKFDELSKRLFRFATQFNDGKMLELILAYKSEMKKMHKEKKLLSKAREAIIPHVKTTIDAQSIEQIPTIDKTSFVNFKQVGFFATTAILVTLGGYFHHKRKQENKQLDYPAELEEVKEQAKEQDPNLPNLALLPVKPVQAKHGKKNKKKQNQALSAFASHAVSSSSAVVFAVKPAEEPAQELASPPGGVKIFLIDEKDKALAEEKVPVADLQQGLRAHA